jgi:SNF2 family DNA or RNA helicase
VIDVEIVAMNNLEIQPLPEIDLERPPRSFEAALKLLHMGVALRQLCGLPPTPAPQPLVPNEAQIEREKELDRLKKTLAFKLTIDYSTVQAKEHAIQSLQTKITSIEEQLKSLRERLTATTIEECPICYDDPKQNSATITPCCHRIFCGACILRSLSSTSSCPLCRGSIQVKELIQLVDDEKKTKKKKDKKEEEKLMSKPKRLLKFLKENPDAKVLVFSRYENPFIALERDCESEGISYHTLRGNKDVIASTIKSFENGEKRVLFLPTESVGAGLNLNTATHVVLIHAMTPEEEKQAIGRAYRLGRTGPLNVVRLLHNGEVNNNNIVV